MRLVLKIFAAPVVAILTVFVAMMMFLLHIAAWLMGLVSVLLAVQIHLYDIPRMPQFLPEVRQPSVHPTLPVQW